MQESVTGIVRELAASSQSVYLGREREDARLCFGRSDEHALVLGPPRCGKTSGLIIPSVAVHPGPVIVTSTRDDVVLATAAARQAVAAEFGGDVTEVSFGGRRSSGAGVATGRWSCTDGCGDWNTALDRSSTLTATAMNGRDEAFWRDAASDLLAGCLFGAALVGDDDRVMARYIKSTDVSRYYNAVVELCPTDHDAPFVFSGVNDINAMAGDTRRSVFATLSAQVLGQFRYEMTRDERMIDLDEFVRGWGTMFITVPAERAATLRPLVAAFVAAVTTAWRAARPASGTLLLALDEVANVAPLPTLPTILTSGAGDGIQCVLGMQEPGQASRWAEEGSVITGGTSHVALFPGLRNHQYLTGISELLGQSVQYDLQVEVKRDTPGGARFADESRLVADECDSRRPDSPHRPTRVRFTCAAPPSISFETDYGPELDAESTRLAPSPT